MTRLSTASHSETMWGKAPQYRGLKPTGVEPVLFRTFAIESPFCALGPLAALTVKELATMWARKRMPPGASDSSIATVISRRQAYLNVWLINLSLRRMFALQYTGENAAVPLQYPPTGCSQHPLEATLGNSSSHPGEVHFWALRVNALQGSF